MSKITDLIEQSNGKFISVTFIKKDGSERVLVGRLGVTKHLKGGTSTLDPAQYITIFDIQNDGYRAINRDTIRSLRIDGQEYTA
jgi:hypothetical protein